MKKLSSFLNLLIVVLVLSLGGAFYYLKSGPETQASVKPILAAKELDKIVNQHLQKTAQQNQLTKFLNEKTVSDARRKLAEFQRQRKIKEDQEISKIPAERQIWKEDQKINEVTPAQIISSQLNESRQQEKMDAAEKKEYARQWILNARKEGYLLELSPDLEVLKYIPIRKPSQQDDSVESFPSD